MLVNYRSLSGLSFTACFLHCFTQGKDCGFPGIPLDGILTVYYLGNQSIWNYIDIVSNESIRRNHWPVETRVEYRCENPRFHLRNGHERICQANGTWSGTLPFCDENMVYNLTATVRNQNSIISKNTTVLTDGRTDDGSKAVNLYYFPKEEIKFHFRDEINIDQVIVYGTGLLVNMENLTVLTDHGTCHRSESSRENVISLTCRDNGKWTRKLLLRHGPRGVFEIFEIQVFARSNRNSCGIPEIRLNGQISFPSIHSSLTSVTYGCNSGFSLVGSEIRQCQGRIWSGEIPRCEAAANISRN